MAGQGSAKAASSKSGGKESKAKNSKGKESAKEKKSRQKSQSATYNSNSSEYNAARSGEYESGSAEYESSSQGHESTGEEGGLEQRIRQTKEKENKKKSASKKSGSDRSENLEEKVINIEKLSGLVAKYQKQGHSYETAIRLAMAAYSGDIPDYVNDSHNWDTEGLINYIKKYFKDGMNIWHVIKENTYLGLVLTDGYDGKNPREEILKKRTRYIFIPGYLQMPRNADRLEKYSGVPMAYFPSNNIDALYNLIKFTYSENGPVRLMGFSDGGKTIAKLRKKYGKEVDSMVDRYFLLAANPESGPMIKINGQFDFLAATEKEYQKYLSSPPDYTIPGVGHAGLIYDADSAKQIGKIMNSYSTRQTYVRKRLPFAPQMPPLMRLAA